MKLQEVFNTKFQNVAWSTSGNLHTAEASIDDLQIRITLHEVPLELDSAGSGSFINVAFETKTTDQHSVSLLGDTKKEFMIFSCVGHAVIDKLNELDSGTTVAATLVIANHEKEREQLYRKLVASPAFSFSGWKVKFSIEGEKYTTLVCPSKSLPKAVVDEIAQYVEQHGKILVR